MEMVPITETVPPPPPSSFFHAPYLFLVYARASLLDGATSSVNPRKFQVIGLEKKRWLEYSMIFLLISAFINHWG